MKTNLVTKIVKVKVIAPHNAFLYKNRYEGGNIPVSSEKASLSSTGLPGLAVRTGKIRAGNSYKKNNDVVLSSKMTSSLSLSLSLDLYWYMSASSPATCKNPPVRKVENKSISFFS
jgi:hypothetical protein